MASASGTMVSPMSPAIKRSTRKRQRPSFFAEEIKTTSALSTSRKHTTTTNSSGRVAQRSTTRQKQSHSAVVSQSHPPAKRARSEIAELQDTVTGLRSQIESATVQMQELRSLVTMLANLYRDEQTANADEDEPPLFSATSSEQDVHEAADEMFSTTSSEYDVYDEDEDDENLLAVPLSPLVP